jgi:hypothetical protein
VSPPIDPSRRKLTFSSSTKHDFLDNRISPPLPGSEGDPTINGATLLVYNSAGLTSDAVTINLPASGWTRIGSGVPKGWRYKDAGGGAVKTLIVSATVSSCAAAAPPFRLLLDEPQQGKHRPAAPPRQPAGMVHRRRRVDQEEAPDVPGLFKGEHNSGAPGSARRRRRGRTTLQRSSPRSGKVKGPLLRRLRTGYQGGWAKWVSARLL